MLEDARVAGTRARLQGPPCSVLSSLSLTERPLLPRPAGHLQRDFDDSQSPDGGQAGAARNLPRRTEPPACPPGMLGMAVSLCCLVTEPLFAVLRGAWLLTPDVTIAPPSPMVTAALLSMWLASTDTPELRRSRKSWRPTSCCWQLRSRTSWHSETLQFFSWATSTCLRSSRQFCGQLWPRAGGSTPLRSAPRAQAAHPSLLASRPPVPAALIAFSATASQFLHCVLSGLSLMPVCRRTGRSLLSSTSTVSMARYSRTGGPGLFVGARAALAKAASSPCFPGAPQTAGGRLSARRMSRLSGAFGALRQKRFSSAQPRNMKLRPRVVHGPSAEGAKTGHHSGAARRESPATTRSRALLV